MELRERFTDGNTDFEVIYRDADSFADLPVEQINQHYGVCFLRG